MAQLILETVTAPTNIACIKYWGKADKKFNTPINSSVSVTLDQDDLCSITSVAASKSFCIDCFDCKAVAALNRAHKHNNIPLLNGYGREVLHAWVNNPLDVCRHRPLPITGLRDDNVGQRRCSIIPLWPQPGQ